MEGGAWDVSASEDMSGTRLSFHCWPSSRLEATRCVAPFGALYTPCRSNNRRNALLFSVIVIKCCCVWLILLHLVCVSTWDFNCHQRSELIKLFSYFPVKKLPPSCSPPTALPYDPVRCSTTACHAVLNPYCQVDFRSKLWVCPFCLTRNHFPPHYVSDFLRVYSSWHLALP